MVTKLYGMQTKQLLEEKYELGQLCLGYSMLDQKPLNQVASSVTALKQIYMNWSEIRSKKLILINLDR